MAYGRLPWHDRAPARMPFPIQHEINLTTVRTDRIGTAEGSYRTIATRAGRAGRGVVFERSASERLEALRCHNQGRVQAAHIELSLWRIDAEKARPDAIPTFARDAALLLGLSRRHAEGCLEIPLREFLSMVDDAASARLREFD